MITFDEINHKYELDGKELKSVSSWIDQFVPEFNAHVVAAMSARNSELSKDEIIAKWNLKSKIALSQGNWVHDSIQYYLKYDSEFENEPVKAFKEHQNENKYYSEIIVHDDECAGTIDLIEVLGDNKVKLHDFKTNADLYKKHGKLIGKFCDLENSPINKYRLQLSKYKEMLEKMKGVEVVELNIWWWNEGKFEIIKVDEVDLSDKRKNKVIKI